MPYRDPLLALDELERDRTVGVFNALNKAGMGVSKSVLDYDSLLKEEEERRNELAQKAIENARADRQQDRADREEVSLNEWRRAQTDMQKEQNRRLVDNDQYGRSRDTLGDEKKNAATNLTNTVRTALNEGATGNDALRRALEILDADPIAKKHLRWQDVQAEIDRQTKEDADRKADEEYRNRIAGARETTADAAAKRAARPPAARGGAGLPKAEGLSAGERSDVARIDANIPSMDRVIEAIKSGKADPGPISNLMVKVRSLVGAYKQGDDDTVAEMDATFTEEMNRLFGTAMSAGELARSARFIPNWSRDDQGLIALLEVMKRKGMEQRLAVIETAATNIDAKGGNGDALRSAFGYAPKRAPEQAGAGGAPSAPSAPPAKKAGPKKEVPPKNAGEGSKAYALRLFNAGFSEEEIMNIVMGK